MDKRKDTIPGLILAGSIGIVSYLLGSRIPLVGGPVFALGLGIFISLFIRSREKYKAGLDFTSKRLLKFAIILLGFGLSIGQILEVGKISLTVMVFTLAVSFGFGAFFGRLFKMDWKLATLISAGTGICGGSAVAALSPVIEARDSHVTYAISATFIFDIVMVILFPIMGLKLGLSDLAYGLWTGTAVNDTSSVIAAAYAFSNKAGEFATIVKLTRTLSIIPTVIFFSYVNERKKIKAGANSLDTSREKLSLKGLFPFFIVFFILAALVNSLGLIPSRLSGILNGLSRFLMVMALAAIGLKTDLGEVKNSGFIPMLHGFIISALVVVVSLGVQVVLGQV